MIDTDFKINGDRIIKHNNIKAKIGFTNKYNHNSFFIEGGTFIKPLTESSDFNEIMSKIENKCRKYIKQSLFNNDFLTNNFLIHFYVCSHRMNKDKKTYLSFQYHFKQKNNQNKSVINLKKEKEDFFINILNNIQKELESEDIKLFKHKKKDEII
jgi:hypothetical protein